MEKLRSVLVYHWQSWNGYLISHLVDETCALEAEWDDTWERLDRRANEPIEAVLFHNSLSNSSRFPARREELLSRLQRKGIRALNAEFADMRKSTLHRMLENAGLRCGRAMCEGRADEALFVKTDLNYGGDAERRLPLELQPLFGSAAECPIRAWNDYRVLTRAEIPHEWWRNSSLVIERYIRSADDTFYRVYGAGNAFIFIRAHSEELIQKEDDHPDDVTIHATQAQVQRVECPGLSRDLQEQVAGFAARYPLDYFCLDVVHDGRGEHTIVDLNLTPHVGFDPLDPRITDWLGRGLSRQVPADR